ncbi:hypothetical protein BV22DRAFT_1135270 [Leucogyrophana mollusca]|uniref:Uncharacterized protein n=1 Tax=Leucogyrophana mollusca TaxID=85980 RepID=A0ACB8AX35_9AGAM|nr:hypothetical protein BV22DRAFT_1135270 [Leucogyrophana mollusca]
MLAEHNDSTRLSNWLQSSRYAVAVETSPLGPDEHVIRLYNFATSLREQRSAEMAAAERRLQSRSAQLAQHQQALCEAARMSRRADLQLSNMRKALASLSNSDAGTPASPAPVDDESRATFDSIVAAAPNGSLQQYLEGLHVDRALTALLPPRPSWMIDVAIAAQEECASARATAEAGYRRCLMQHRMHTADFDAAKAAFQAADEMVQSLIQVCPFLQ